MNLILSILLAHVLGDFYFQSNKMANNKKKHIVLHVTVYTLIVTLVYWFMTKSTTVFILGGIVFSTHLVIDLFTSVILKSKDYQSYDVLIYIFDQILHVSILIVFIYYFTRSKFMDKSVNNILLTTVVFFYLVMPTSILIDKILCVVSKNTIHRGFQLDEGTVIGILERLLILIMGILGSISGVGFLIAAKTMVRYGEFESETKGSNFRSKYLIGTLLSVLLGYIHYLIFNSLKSG